MLRLPRQMEDIRTVLNVVNWRELEIQVEAETRSHLAIVGPVNVGKSSLFNTIEGREVSEVSPIPGTTREAISESFGPFTLVDTPGLDEASGRSRQEIAEQTIERSDAVILLFDAGAGLRQTDVDLYRRIKQTGKPLLVALNKIDLIREKDRAGVVNDAEYKLSTSVIPVSAKSGEGLADRLVPAIVDLHPRVAVALGRALPAYRRRAANRVIREATLVAGGIGLEPIPIIDLPLLVGHQLRMVLRIAAIYGEPFSVQHARELISTIAGSVGIRFLGEQAARFLPGPGWLIAAGFASGGTFAIGKTAIAYFESGKQLDTTQLRALYQRLRRQKQPAQQENA